MTKKLKETEVINFLKNYQKFGCKVRHTSAMLYLETLKTNSDPDLQRICMLRIYEEVIAATEDLAAWFIAIPKGGGNKFYRNVWERLLGCEVTTESAMDTLKKFNRVRTADGLLKKLELPLTKVILKNTTVTEVNLRASFAKLLETIKSSIQNRTIKGGILVRAQNKIKHGMMVQSEGPGIYIRDLRIKNKRRKNKNMILPVDINRAEKIVGTIKSISYAIKFLASLVLINYTIKYKSLTKQLSIIKV